MRRAVLGAVVWGSLAVGVDAAAHAQAGTPPEAAPPTAPVAPVAPGASPEVPGAPSEEPPPPAPPPTPAVAAPPPAVDPAAASTPAAEPPAAALPPPPAPPPAPPPEPYVEPSAPVTASPNAPASTTAVAIDAAAPAAEGDADEDAPKLPWRASTVLWDHGVTKNTFDRESQLSYDPTYVWSFSIRPRWYFTDTLSVRLIQDLELELTDSNSTTHENQVLFDDTRLDLVESELVVVEEITLRVGGTLRLPLSLASQAERRIAGLGPIVGASREFPVLDGLELDLSGSYRYNIATRNVPATETSYSCRRVGDELSTGCDQASGLSSVEHVIGVNFDATLAVHEQVSFTAGGGGGWARGRGLASVSLSDVGVAGTDAVLEDESETHWRNLTDVHVSVSYEPEAWFALDLGLTTLTGHQDVTSGRRNPIWNDDTMLSLTMTVSADELYLYARDEGTGEAP